MKSSRDGKVAFLRQLDLFDGAADAELLQVAAVADEITLPPGKILTKQGTWGDEFAFIVSGSVEISKAGSPVAQLGPGDYVGEIALLTDQPRSATALALTSVTLLVISRPRFRTLTDQLPDVRTRLTAHASSHSIL